MQFRRRGNPEYIYTDHGGYDEEEEVFGSLAESIHDSIEDDDYYDEMDDDSSHDHTALSQTSLLRTPTNDVLQQRSSNCNFLSSVNSPSPLRTFKIREVSHLSSNLPRGGVTHMRFTGADVSQSKAVHIGQSKSSVQPKRELSSPPAANKREIKMETPSKGYDDDEDPMFSMASSSIVRMRDIPEITSGPIESSLYPLMEGVYLPSVEGFSLDDCDWDGMEEGDDSDEEEYTPINNSSPPLRPKILQHGVAAASGSSAAAAAVRQPLGDLQQNTLKRRAEDGLKSSQEIKRANYGGKKWEDSSLTIGEDVKPDISKLKASLAAAAGSDGAAAAAAAAKSKTTFRTPKKPFKAYSKRWWQVCTGMTPEQRTMTTQAHAFLRRHGVTAAASTMRTKTPVIQKQEGSIFDEDINFAPYLTGIDTSYAAPEDPLNYQPPLLMY